MDTPDESVKRVLDSSERESMNPPRYDSSGKCLPVHE